MTDGGAVIKTSGVNPDAPKEELDFGAAGKAYLERAKAKPAEERTVAEHITAAVAEEQLEPEVEDDGTHGDLTWHPEIANGRWRGTDGKFVKAPPPTEEEIAAAPPEAVAPPTPEKGEKAATPPSAKKIVLPGETDRGEEDVEVEIDDPVIAERLERLRNQGMRRRAYDEAMAEVTTSRAELAALEEQLSIDPVGFAINRMTPERQLEVARALILEHFDALSEDINEIAEDPAKRHERRVALRDDMQRSSDQLSETRARQQHAAACMRSAESLAPEGTDRATIDLFLADAEQDLIRAARAGKPVTPETVPQILAARAKLYRFGEPGSKTAATNGNGTSDTPAPGSARPVSDRAKAIADRKKDVTEQQARIRRVQTLRRSAAAIAPPGVGAATVSAPVIPADADIASASRLLQRSGKLRRDGWGPPTT